MRLNNKIVLSALVAAALTFTGCSDSDDTTTPAAETPDDNSTTGVTIDPTSPNYTGDGADDAQERHLTNDAVFTLPTTHSVASVSFEQSIVATLAAGKTLDTTTLVGDITVNTTLTSDKKYQLDGLVTVKGDVTLTIEPGTIIFGDTTNDDYIVITKGSKIEAAGTEANPIYFTSAAALGDASTADVGQWGGLTILGDAPTNDASTPSYEVDETNADFVYGGTNSADNSGTLTHVYILNSGVTMSTDQEVNGLSLCGVGSATTVENIHVENSADDGIEIWGGTVNVTNATLVNCLDDSFDLDSGYVGTATNITVEQVDAAHAGFEISSGGTTPMTSPTIVNFTINKVNGSDEGGIYIKDDSTAPTFVNGFVTTQGTDAGIYAKKVMPNDQKAALSFSNVILNSDVRYTGDGAADAQERYELNDATPSSISFEQIVVATLAAGKTLDTTTLVGDITVNTTLTSDKKYQLDGLVTVKGDVTLTIEPGTIIFGDTTNDDYIVITKGSKIEAAGTEANPIYFTSAAALGDASTADVGQWGGLTILGDAPTNDASTPSYEVDETNADFVYGGTNSADNSGTLTHVYILNSGVTMSTDQEVNGLSLCGVGSATTVENIHVENSADDGIEIWGGTVNVTNATLVNCLDDSFDLDSGYVGTATNITVEQVDAAHAGFEISSGGTTPMTSPTIVNFTINKVNGSDEGGIYIKDDSTAPTFVNGFVTTQGTDAGIYAKKVMPADQKAALAFKDVILNIQ